MFLDRVGVVTSRHVCGIALLFVVAGCVTFRGDRTLITSESAAVGALQRHEGVWYGRIESDDGKTFESEYIVRLFRADNGRFCLNVHLYDPKRKDRVRNQVYNIEVLEGNGGILLFVNPRGPEKDDAGWFVFFAKIEDHDAKVYFTRAVDDPNGANTRAEGAVELAIESQADLAALKRDPMQFFDATKWIALRFLDMKAAIPIRDHDDADR